MKTEIGHRFAYHPPTAGAVVSAHEGVRDLTGDLATYFTAHLPEGREKALAITKLEEAMFWANASIARNHEAVIEGRS